MPTPHIVVLTGAGISAESGLKTFRDSGGLWEGHRPETVATPGAWQRDRELVLRFYNQRRTQLAEVAPNPAHLALVDLEKHFEVTIITQNVDDLHERAGSTNVLHLHGELTKVRSTLDPSLIYDWGYRELHPGDRCSRGSQLRPHIVWFGEPVPAIEAAIPIVQSADYILVIGTSLVVYPAASLIHDAPFHAIRAVVNPEIPAGITQLGFEAIAAPASIGVPQLVQRWCNSKN
jgi:NAD-dependent deacetylase